MSDLGIILPVHNEVQSIEKVLAEWKENLDKMQVDYEFVICEDGSTDGTKELLKDLIDRFPIRLSQKDEQRGYGKAVTDGMQTAESDYILSIDSDGQCDPKDFDEFWRRKGEADVLIGWRTNRQDMLHRKLYSNTFKLFFKMLFPLSLHDPSAPYVLYRKEQIVTNIKYLMYMQEGFWWGFVAMCSKKDISIKEIPVNHRLRLDGGTRVFTMNKIFNIAMRNVVGLVKLKLAK
jgi:glycosyltransferase involved in cell wall biosynthesis